MPAPLVDAPLISSQPEGLPSLAPFFSLPPYGEGLWKLRPMISPHPAAPIFEAADGSLVLEQILAEASGDTFPASEKFLKLIKQAATVSLWFFLKVVAAHSGAYDKINNELHLEMANFRQLCLTPGIYAGIFTPRSSFKSTIVDFGSIPWEFARDKTLTVGIFSANADKAQEFYMQAKATMDSNELFRDLWPGVVPTNIGRGSEWNDSYLNLADRGHRKATPSLKAYTASGGVSGTHIGLSIIDDIINDSMLNAARQATSELIEKRNWFWTNIRSLREEPEISRTIVAGTRYSIEDPYEGVMADAYMQLGDWSATRGRYPVKPDGNWAVYYRSAKAWVGEEEFSIQPKAYSLKFLNKLAVDDPWTFHYQYENNAVGTAGAELGSYEPSECIFEEEGIRISNTDEFISYAACDVTVAIDPAGSDRRASARTSQTAMCIICRDEQGRKFVDGKKGYVKTTQWLDWIFAKASFFGDGLGRTVIEEVSGFKSLDSLIVREQYMRGIRLKYRSTPALGDKVSTIKALVQPELERGRLYFNVRARAAFMDEMKIFPNGFAMDLLDALKIAIKMSQNPEWQMQSDADEAEPLRGARSSTAY